ncbi:MAG: GPW/gp25 family protein [Candidatus Promineifilaceae bacterium]
MTDIAFPFKVDGRGRAATAGSEAHVRQLIEQLLFTAPGERVNRPEFGAGVMQLVFAPNSPELATATEYMIQSALQRYLGEVIQPEAVRVESDDARLTITVRYLLRRSQERREVSLSREL